MHDTAAGSDLIMFFHDPLSFIMDWRDIFSQHMHDALTGCACVPSAVYALGHAQTHTFMHTDRYVTSHRQRTGAWRH